MGNFIMFVFGALAGAWWVKHKEERKMWMRFRRDMIRDASRKQSPCTDGDDGFEVIGKRGFTDSDKERLRDLGSQAKEIATEYGDTLLDTAFSALESLRVKLAEQKEQKERLMKGPVDEKRV